MRAGGIAEEDAESPEAADRTISGILNESPLVIRVNVPSFWLRTEKPTRPESLQQEERASPERQTGDICFVKKRIPPC